MSSRATYCSVIRSTTIYAYEYYWTVNVVQWQSRTGGFVPARLARACWKIAKISNFTLLRASRLRKDRLIDFRNFLHHFVRLLFSKKMSRCTYLCVAPSIDAIAVTTVPKLAVCIETIQICVPRRFFGSLTDSAREPEPRIVSIL